MKKIALFGVPRSGTSWLSQILNSHPDVAMRFQPLFSYAHKGKLDAHSDGDAITAFFDEILHSEDRFALMSSEFHRDYPRFAKSPMPTHIAFKETRFLHIVENLLGRCPDIHVIGIVRNPLANLASWVRAPKEFDPAWDILSEWRLAPSKNQSRPEEFYGFEKWKQATASFIVCAAAFPGRFLLQPYAELNHTTDECVARIFDFCALRPHAQVDEFIRASKSRHDPDPYSVFRSGANDSSWRDVIPTSIVSTVKEELSGTPLERFLDDQDAGCRLTGTN